MRSTGSPCAGPDGFTTEHRQPPRRFRLSYLITCWTQRPEDEHRLLSSLLACFLRYPVLPTDVLAGALSETSLPLFTTIALPPPADRSIADVWSALGGELKPSLDLVVTAPMDANAPIAAAPPVLEAPFVRVTRHDGATDDAGGRTGRRAQARRPLSPREPASQEEVVTARQGPESATDEGAEATSGAAKGKGRKSAAAPTPPSTALLPGRRIIVRGVRRA